MVLTMIKLHTRLGVSHKALRAISNWYGTQKTVTGLRVSDALDRSNAPHLCLVGTSRHKQKADKYQLGVRRQLSWPVRVNHDGRLGFLIFPSSSLF